MDTAVLRKLLEHFVAMVDEPQLQADFPEQFSKHWENKGRSGTVQIFQTRLVDQPCEVKFSLFFDGDEVIQTGVHVLFRGEPIINEVHKGDLLDYRRQQRIDPIAFLKANYGSLGKNPESAVSTSFALEINDDAEPQLMRAVCLLRGRSEEALRAEWEYLVSSNATRGAHGQVSPIIRTWLKKERDRYDFYYLTNARLLTERPSAMVQFAADARLYTIITRLMPGHVIREKVDCTDAPWWGGQFYSISQGKLVRVPRDARERVLAVRSLADSAAITVEEIHIDLRHAFSVLFFGEEALVWRTLNAVPDEPMGVTDVREDPAGRTFARVGGREVDVTVAAGEEEPKGPPAAHPYRALQAENAYMEALKKKSPDLSQRRSEYLQLAYEADPERFRGNAEELKSELTGAAVKAARKDGSLLDRERALIDAHVTIFYLETESPLS